MVWSYRLDMRRSIRGAAVLLPCLLAISASGAPSPDFSGRWRQQTDSGPQRRLDVEQNGQTLHVRTTVSNAKGTRRLDVSYQIGGPETIYKGLDGDEFHTSVHWESGALVFVTVEHERGSEIPETTVWRLSEDHDHLQVTRQSRKSGKTKDSLTSYVREP